MRIVWSGYVAASAALIPTAAAAAAVPTNWRLFSMVSSRHFSFAYPMKRSVAALADRRREGGRGVPGKIDPGVLRDFGDEGVDQRPAHRLGIDRGEVRGGENIAHNARGFSGVDQVVDDEHALALPAHRGDFRANALHHLDVALVLVIVIARDAHGLDDAHVEYARHDRGRHQAAAGDADDRLERPRLVQAPGQRAGVAVKLVP